MTRRAILASLAGAAATPLLAQASPALAKLARAGRKLGIQMYMMGDDVGKDLDGALKKVASIGYREVELPQFYGRDGAVMAKALSGAGLSCPSFHAGLTPLYPGMPAFDQPERVIALARDVGAKYIVVPVFPFPQRLLTPMKDGEQSIDYLLRVGSTLSVDDWKDIAAQLNKTGAILAKHGMKIGYHNRHPEFVKLPDGRFPLEILIAETDPALVTFEFDVGWAAMRSIDPVAFIKRHGKRIRQLHLRDVRRTGAGAGQDLEFCDVGDGIVNWPALLAASKRAGIEHFYVEQDPPFALSREESARRAFAHLTKVGV